MSFLSSSGNWVRPPSLSAIFHLTLCSWSSSASLLRLMWKSCLGIPMFLFSTSISCSISGTISMVRHPRVFLDLRMSP